jgi:CheY-like chemotaxis protein
MRLATFRVDKLAISAAEFGTTLAIPFGFSGLGAGLGSATLSSPPSPSRNVFYPTYGNPCIEPQAAERQNLTFMHKRVLIADDSSSVRDVIRTCLRDQEGIEVCGEAADGLETVQKAQSLKPDLVLLDLVMPEINGAEVASILKQKMPDIRIILFTMYTDRIGKYLSSAVGVDAVLSKPDGMNDIVESINSLFRN